MLLPIVSMGQKQMKTLGNLYVPSGGSMALFGELLFADGETRSQLMTDRTEKNGKILFAKGSQWLGKSGVQFIDGYASVLHNDAFTFPIGHEEIYAPVAISGANNTSVAYFNSTASDLASSEMISIMDNGYWDVKGDSPIKLTIAYNSFHNMASLTHGDLSSLRIIGLQDGEWKIIPSSVDEKALDVLVSEVVYNGKSDISSGSLTTTEEILPSDYEFFTLANVTEASSLLYNNGIALNVYPNPSVIGREFNIQYDIPGKADGELRIYDNNNRLISTRSIQAGVGEIKILEDELHEGSYILSLSDDLGNSSHRKLIVVSN